MATLNHAKIKLHLSRISLLPILLFTADRRNSWLAMEFKGRPCHGVFRLRQIMSKLTVVQVVFRIVRSSACFDRSTRNAISMKLVFLLYMPVRRALSQLDCESCKYRICMLCSIHHNKAAVIAKESAPLLLCSL